MNQMIGQSRQLGHPQSHKFAAAVVLNTVLHWVVHANSIRSRGARLHLKLRVMNSRFVVQKIFGQMVNPLAPINIQVVR